MIISSNRHLLKAQARPHSWRLAAVSRWCRCREVRKARSNPPAHSPRSLPRHFSTWLPSTRMPFYSCRLRLIFNHLSTFHQRARNRMLTYKIVKNRILRPLRRKNRSKDTVLDEEHQLIQSSNFLTSQILIPIKINWQLLISI